MKSALCTLLENEMHKVTQSAQELGCTFTFVAAF